MSRYKDFDEMWSEMKCETIPFRAFGREYRIRKQIPAAIVLEMAAREGEPGAKLPAELIYRAARLIFGREALDEMCAHEDFTVDRLNSMIQWAFDAVSGSDGAESEEVTEDTVGVVPRKN